MAEAIVRKCTCKHSEQDRLHGTQNRVANPTSKAKDGYIESRCTVCGSIATTSVK